MFEYPFVAFKREKKVPVSKEYRGVKYVNTGNEFTPYECNCSSFQNENEVKAFIDETFFTPNDMFEPNRLAV